jgi:hypothetical protein
LYYIATNQRGNKEVFDDGLGASTAPPYGVTSSNRRYELTPGAQLALMDQWNASYSTEIFAVREHKERSALPLGDAVARVTSSLGLKGCVPCKRRQDLLNHLFDPVMDYWRSWGHGR